MESQVYNGSAYEPIRHLYVCTGATTFEEVASAWQYDAGGWYQLYKRHVRSFALDNFNRPDGFIQSPWVPTGGIEIVDNAVQMATNGSNGTYYAWAIRTDQQANSDRTFVQATLADTGHTSRGGLRIQPSWILLAANSTGSSSVFLTWDGTELSLWRKDDGNDTLVHNGVTISQSVGAVMRLERGGGAASTNTFSAYINGVHKFTWTDTGNTVPLGPARRYSGFGLTYQRGFFDDDWSPRLDNWSGGDQDY